MDASFAGTGRHIVSAGGLLVAWNATEAMAGNGFVVVGAHTDSPNLRVRTHPDLASAGWEQVGMEVYGGVLANSWLDRDLGVAGRVLLRSTEGTVTRLVRDDHPILRIPQLAIHLDREIREKGLLVDPQKHMIPLWAIGPGTPGTFAAYVAELAEATVDDIVSWDLMAFDTQPPAIVGRDRDLFASARIDNLFSTFCGVHALIDAVEDPGPRIPVLVLYDHEEVGSESATGAGGAVLGQRARADLGCRRDRSSGSSRGDDQVVRRLGGRGPRHAPELRRQARPQPPHHDQRRCRREAQRQSALRIRRGQRGAVPCAVPRPSASPCRPTSIATTCRAAPPSVRSPAARLGVPTIDVGAPQFAMHSIREMAGVADIGHLTQALSCHVAIGLMAH